MKMEEMGIKAKLRREREEREREIEMEMEIKMVQQEAGRSTVPPRTNQVAEYV